MNSSLLTIGNILPVPTAPAQVSSKGSKNQDSRQFYPIQPDNQPCGQAQQSAESDKTNTLNKKTSIDGNQEGKANDSHQAIEPPMPQQSHDLETKSKQAQESLTGILAAESGNDLATLLAGLKPDISSGTAQTSLAAVTSDTRIDIKALLSETSVAQFTAGTQNAQQSKNAAGVPTADNAQAIANQQNAKGSDAGLLLSADGRTTEVNAAPSTSGMSAVSVDQKTSALNTALTTAQPKSSDPSSGIDQAEMEKSLPKAQQSADSKNLTAQILSGSSAGTNVASQQTQTGLSGESAAEKLNLTDLQPPIGQAKEQEGSNSHSSSNSGFEQSIMHTNSQAVGTELFTNASDQVAGSPAAQVPGNTSAGLREQLAESIYTSLAGESGSRQITVRLYPPELGKVFIRFYQQQDQITGLLQVSKVQTRNEIEHLLPDIIKTLQNAGIQIKKLEITLTDQQDHQPANPKDQSFQDGLFGKDGFSQNYRSPQGTDESWPENAPGYQDISEPQILAAGETLNLLM